MFSERATNAARIFPRMAFSEEVRAKRAEGVGAGATESRRQK